MQYLKHLLILLAIVSTTFFVSNVLINGSLNHKLNLSGELKSPADSLYQWKISQEAPFKYRVLHRVIVGGIYQILSNDRNNNELFFTTYRIMAFIFHLLAICIFYYFLSQTHLKIYSLPGAVIFALLPAMSLAYNVPVHTREDTLAYSILLLGLVSILKNKPAWILAFSILGLLCRETLLLLPFVNLFYNLKQKPWIRLSTAAFCFLVFFAIRIYFGNSNYNHWEGLRWNIQNLEQVIGFAYITFGFLWLPILTSLIDQSNGIAIIPIITPSRLAVTILILITTFVGGIFNEIRLLNLLAPWIIVLALSYFENSKFKESIQLLLKSRWYIIFILTAAIIAVGFAMVILTNGSILIDKSKYQIPYGAWISVTFIQVYLSIISLPIFVTYLRKSSRQF